MGIEYPEKSPQWINDLVREVADRFQPLGFIGQIGFRYLDPDAPENSTHCWLIGVYLVPHELSGGQHDGAAVVAGFCLNINGILSLFSNVRTLEWRAPRRYTGGLAGPEVWLEGVYRESEKVQLHIYSEPPDEEMPALVLDVTTNVLRAK